ncbi:DNA ligase [Paraburkholderia humisilvae]|uniref:Bifunctional non-homologous end joining protein LigD n=1 Tax=Paraburkholderia humisilvae TaxID=627669 RepID=A0A6J5DMP8_9BURK|nr:DNA ligase [Paraburkholderia humisilvae]CAB3754797.1 Bifunctional non-homologous end joining protein LigD [Paraburkholderia humisilvae]
MDLERPIKPSDLMHAMQRRRPFSHVDWLFQWKLDGFRCLVEKWGDKVALTSRQGKPFNRSFPEIVEAVAAVPGDFVWDSELAIGDARGPASFSRLLERSSTTSPRNIPAAARRHPARIFVFDMLLSGKRDLRHLELTERKARLRDAFDDTQRLVYVTDVECVGELVFEQVKIHDFEGMVAKRKASTYTRGRSPNWIKIKNINYSRPAALGFGHADK